MAFWRDVNPSGAIFDFVELFREAGPRRWPFAALAALITVLMISSLGLESWKKQRGLPEVTYITSWPIDRTEAETRAFIAENQHRKEAEQAEQATREREAQAMWMAVGRASGLDVNKMKLAADADRARETAAAAQREQQILKRIRFDPGQSAPGGAAPVGR